MEANIVSLVGCLPGLFHSLSPVLSLQLIIVDHHRIYLSSIVVTSRVIAVHAMCSCSHG